MPEPTPHLDHVLSTEIETYELINPPSLSQTDSGSNPRNRRFQLIYLIHLLCIAAILLNVAILVSAMGGWRALTTKSTIFRDDHPLYFYSSLITRDFLKLSGSTAGYDPTFMAGYAKSAVFPASSTLPEIVMAATQSAVEPAVAYKFYVLISASLAPLILWWAAAGLTSSKAAGASSSILYLLYIWTDFPIQYVGFGMIPYFLSIPLAMATLRICCAWLQQKKKKLWLGMTALLCLTTLVHFTALMILGPAVLAAWVVSDHKTRSAFMGLLSLASCALFNSFWWWPGVVLASTKGDSGFAFSHPEGILARLGKILWSESPIEPLLIIGLLAGTPLLYKTRRIAGAGLLGFAGAGFFWGYGAGVFRSLDFLQPGRHTYAFYLSACIFSSVIAGTVFEWLKRTNRVSALGLAFGSFLFLVRIYGPILESVKTSWTSPSSPALSSSSPAVYTSLRQAIAKNVQKGERILYEEGGFGGDPFSGGRFSALLARDLGIEIIGGPYLHASLTTNVAQFGEGKLFGRSDWDQAWLQAVSKTYGIRLIVYWSDNARKIIDDNPDKFQVVHRDGPFRIALILASDQIRCGTPILGESFVEGPVEAVPGSLRLELRDASAGIEVDRIVVLRYHWVPGLQVIGHKDVSIEPESSPDKTLPPLIRLRLKPAAKGPMEIRLNPWGGLASGS